MKRLIILRGHQGSGKSTYAKGLIAHFLENNPDGRSVAVPFIEIRTFYSDGKKINQFNALDVFMETITDSHTGQINLNAIDKSEIFCDETNRFSAAEMLEKIKNNIK